ncbi:PREDICTED: transmembrane protein 62-like [Dufourea novaeangliae]|uniref:transmembrane protein 62-like n=1 Tax=Dufourea novaeangliae TaxID=178035 RepID=UPI0007677486|nr:PREDICTED: transmembrane protein 62-like [Dufourea novaeangliae]
MKITKSTIVLLVFVLMLSILVANVADLINVDTHVLDDTLSNKYTREEWSRPRYYDIGTTFDHLIWFLQISDIHISIFRDPFRITELKEFCNVTVDIIKPSVVLASGDLTDAKAKDKMGSKQILEEWKYYKQVLDETEVAKKTLWLDVRGNHDNFNVVSLEAKNNYYSNYSIQGKKHPRSYMYTINIGSELYTFIAVDACLKPGPRRPFNFVGVLDEQEIKSIHSLVNKSQESNADFVIWFGHYPTSCILSQTNTGVRNIIGRYKESMVYLCGHYHTLGGTVPNMYTLQQAGFLELELADWKDNRMYRLAAIDHGQFSFIDVKHEEWPVVLITNPKHALYTMPRKENVLSVVKSTHIRVLAFSIAPIKSVEVQLDDATWFKCEHVKGPLYTFKWNTAEYMNGIHTIRVRVVDTDGRETIVFQPFALDGSRLSFRILPRLILMSNVSNIFQFLFGTVLILLVVPLCLLRFLHILCEKKQMHRPRLRIKFFHLWLRKLWILSTVDRLCFPLVLYALYLTIGPWAIGEVIDNHTGVIFAWGTFVGNSYLPGAFTYAYGFFQLFSFHLPLMLILAHRVDKRLQSFNKPGHKSVSKVCILWQHLPITLLVIMQVSMAYFFWLAYGTLATVLCPLRTWSILLAIMLWHQVNTMPQSCLRSATAIWSPHG